jgi:signal transduction histidine kinase/CheY-like chemotaxis protein
MKQTSFLFNRDERIQERHFIRLYLALFIGFIATGLALSFVSFQSQIMPIGLPAGIALIGVYLLGVKFVPAVFLSSFIFNTTVSADFSSSTLFSLLSIQNLLIALGASIQAYVGAYLLKFYVGDPLTLKRNSKVVKFIFIVGIAVNLISANIGVLALSFFNDSISTEDYWLNMTYWWLGDSLGILLVVPFALALLPLKLDKINEFRTRRIIISSVLSLFLSVVAITWLFIDSTRESVQTELDKGAQEIENQIYRELSKSVNLLEELASFIQSDDQINRSDFDKKAAQLLSNSDVIKAMSWNPMIPQSMIQKHNLALVQDYGATAKIKGTPLTSQDPIIYVKHIFPVEGNKNAIGFNVFSNPARKQTLKNVLDNNQPNSTPIIQLVQSEHPQPAFLLFFPVYKSIAGEYGNNYLSIIGMSTGVFLVEQLLKNAIAQTDNSFFYIEVSESGKADAFFKNFDNQESILEQDLFKKVTVDLIGQSWQVKLSVNQTILVAQQNRSYLLLFILQFFVVSVIMLVILLMNTQQQILNKMVANKTVSLKKAMIEANQANDAKTRFLANMSHEIRTPMNSVVGFAQLAQKSDDINEIHSYLEKIDTSSHLLLNIVNDILDISKIESDKFSLSQEPFDMNKSISRVADVFSGLAEGKSLTWRLENLIPEKLYVNGDQTRFEQVLMNLCGNAIKFTQVGGVAMQCRKLESNETSIKLEVKVIDSGIGIAPEKRKDLFKPFTQADASTSRNFGGTGLGLTISRELSRMMGGDIDIEKNTQRGSIFIFTCQFPLSEAPMERQTKNNDVNLSSINVLVAEDNSVNQKVIDAMLKKLNIQHTIVENGREAITALMSGNFDLILMDCQMPVLDGYEATIEIRQKTQYKTLPIVALTADADAKSKKYAMSIGFSEHLTKPITLEKLETCLVNVLS